MKDLLNELSIDEKISFLYGMDNKKTYEVKRLDIPYLFMADGSCGLRVENEFGNSMTGIDNSYPATCFPASLNMAMTFNKNLVYEAGVALGCEAKYFGVDFLLAPAINIKKNPRCGRNFEYFSEDPILSGELSGYMIKGIEENTSSTIKHFICNNNETYRFVGNSIIDEKALREIYLRNFKIALDIGKPKALMTSYNMINGYFASENKYLLNILRNEWNYDGIIMTDWGGINDRAKALNASLDIEMPGANIHSFNLVKKELKSNPDLIKNIDSSVKRILSIKKSEKIDYDFNISHNIAYKCAIESITLLKNNNDILPLNKKDKLLIIGDLFIHPRYQASGSSLVNPKNLIDFISSFKDINYEFVKGYDLEDNKIDDKLIDDAISKANNYDKVLLFIGLNDYIESEGYDRNNLSLPNNQLLLIEKLLKLDIKINVILFGGNVIELPFINNIESLLYVGLLGEAIGKALKDILFGKISPSGRLTETWINNKDIIFDNEINKPNTLYKESIYIGYRYYDTFNKKVVFPFGYGLNYAKIRYDNIKIKKDNDNIIINLDVINESNIKQLHSVLVFSSLNDSLTIRAKKELKGFEKINLMEYETKNIDIKIPLSYMMIYNDNKWIIEDGIYDFYIEDKNISIKIDGKIPVSDKHTLFYKDIDDLNKINDEDFLKLTNNNYLYKAKFPYDMNTMIRDYKTLFGIIFKKIIKHVFYKSYKKSLKIKDYKLRTKKKKSALFIYKMIDENSLRSLYASSNGLLKYNMAYGILLIINYRIFSGIYYLLKKEKRLK